VYSVTAVDSVVVDVVLTKISTITVEYMVVADMTVVVPYTVTSAVHTSSRTVVVSRGVCLVPIVSLTPRPRTNNPTPSDGHVLDGGNMIAVL
jgi:hypothetical protein